MNYSKEYIKELQSKCEEFAKPYKLIVCETTIWPDEDSDQDFEPYDVGQVGIKIKRCGQWYGSYITIFPVENTDEENVKECIMLLKENLEEALKEMEPWDEREEL